MGTVAGLVLVASLGFVVYIWIVLILPLFLEGHWIMALLMTGVCTLVLRPATDLYEKWGPKSPEEEKTDGPENNNDQSGKE